MQEQRRTVTGRLRLAVFAPAQSSAAEDVRRLAMPMADNSLQKTAKTAMNAMPRMIPSRLYTPREGVRTPERISTRFISLRKNVRVQEGVLGQRTVRRPRALPRCRARR